MVDARRPTLGVCLAAIAFALAAQRPGFAEPRIEMELAFEPGFPITGAQAWVAALEKLGVANVRIRQARGGERTEINASGSGANAVYRVAGVLTTSSKLMVPAGSFTLADKAVLAEWLDKLKAGGIEELAAPRTAFGLTEREFAAFRATMAQPLAFSTKDRSARECVPALVRGLGLPAAMDGSARAALERDWRIPEELEGLSQGTVLAAMLRPLGLAFAPQREVGGKVTLRIAPHADLPETWPVGWPPVKNPQETMPALFKFLNVEIADTPLPEALGAIQSRLETPFLYDHNALARDRIELEAVRASIPAGRTFYKRILDRLLFQAKLKSEVRIDEAGQPFLWITSVKP